MTWLGLVTSSLCVVGQGDNLDLYTDFSPHIVDADTILTLYKAHVLPMLYYASIVWDPHLRKDQLLLQSVQHIALKIASWSWNLDYQTLRTCYDLAPLMNRRSYFKLLATFKFVHGFLYCPGGYFLYKQTPNLRISHTKQLVQPFARCTAGNTKCRTPGSYSVCAVRTLLGINQKILSIRKEPMLSGFSHSKCSEHSASCWK